MHTLTGTNRFHALDLQLHLSDSQWAVIKTCSTRSIAVRSNSSTRRSTESLPTEGSSVKGPNHDTEWNIWCINSGRKVTPQEKEGPTSQSTESSGLMATEQELHIAATPGSARLAVPKHFFFLAIPFCFPTLPSRHSSGTTSTIGSDTTDWARAIPAWVLPPVSAL